jgi:hypothetical protein
VSSTMKSPRVRSKHEPQVRDGLCRHIRCKGMIVNMHEDPENDSTQRGYLLFDKNALSWDSTVWWCTQTSKTLGPDDRPCHKERCLSGRACYEAEGGSDRVA